MPARVPCSGSRPKTLALALTVAVLLPLSLYYHSKASLKENEDSFRSSLAPDEKAAAAGPPQRKAGDLNFQTAKAKVAMSPATFLKAIPRVREEQLEGVAVETNTRHVFVGKKLRVFCRETTMLSKEKVSPVGYVLLLHGHAFTSADWEELGTLSFLAKLQLGVIAVDLPGHGRSGPGPTPSPLTFMEDLVTVLKLDSSPFILVSPSMSGKYSLPYLVAHPEKVKGYVPVAPGGTEVYVDQYPSIFVPTVDVIGSHDTKQGPKSVKDLSHLQNFATALLEKAGHPAYRDQPEFWHRVLYNFINFLYPLIPTDNDVY